MGREWCGSARADGKEKSEGKRRFSFSPLPILPFAPAQLNQFLCHFRAAALLNATCSFCSTKRVTGDEAATKPPAASPQRVIDSNDQSLHDHHSRNSSPNGQTNKNRAANDAPGVDYHRLKHQRKEYPQKFPPSTK